MKSKNKTKKSKHLFNPDDPSKSFDVCVIIQMIQYVKYSTVEVKKYNKKLKTYRQKYTKEFG